MLETMGLEEIPYAFFYYFDEKRRLLVHAYDDRGMDMVAMNKDVLRPLYQDYNAWLLDYDRQKINSVFM